MVTALVVVDKYFIKPFKSRENMKALVLEVKERLYALFRTPSQKKRKA